MKIRNDLQPTLVEFGTLKTGDVFKSSGDVFMKLADLCGGRGQLVNVVYLKDGSSGYFVSHAYVQPLEAELSYHEKGTWE